MTLLQGLLIAGGALGLFVFLSFMVLALTWLERKALARIHMRMGPMFVGFHGTLQPLADAMKLMTKEDILPSWADKKVYWLAPLAVFIPSLMLWVTIPLSRDVVLQNLDMGLFYITAVSVLTVLGLVMAGWGSANKYAILGGLRAAGQLISYEIPFIMALLGVAIVAQSLDLREIVDAQSRFAFILIQPLGFFLFLIAGLAELGRTPFDIHHAESEVVGGPFVEYSGAHWAVFFLAEYMNTFTVAALTALLFLGGWGWPAMPFEGLAHTTLSIAWFLFKTYLVVLLIFWIRGTYPRLRIDQLMSFGWKMLVPLSFMNIVASAVVLFYGWPIWALSAISLLLLAGAVLQMFSHGVMTALFFAAVGVVYSRTHTRDMMVLNGLAKRMGFTATFFAVAGLTSLGLPGLSGFVAELLVFLGLFQTYPLLGVLGVIGAGITAVYILRLLARVFFGPLGEQWQDQTDASRVERVSIVALTAVILLVGLFPFPFIRVINAGVAEMLGRIAGA